MKTKEELLKIYSAYLPHELKGKRTDGAKGDYILRAVYDDGSMIWKYNGFGNSRQIGVLPVLYSLDMLTKEIEHKSERFIPSKKLGLKENDILALKAWGEISGRLLHKDFDKLIEWQFNVFGLEEREYIKKQN